MQHEYPSFNPIHHPDPPPVDYTGCPGETEYLLTVPTIVMSLVDDQADRADNNRNYPNEILSIWPDWKSGHYNKESVRDTVHVAKSINYEVIGGA